MKNLFKSLVLLSFIYSDCPDLNTESECNEWPTYCEWNDELGQCQNLGGGGDTGGGSSEDGPYDYETITESQGLRNGPDYRDGVVYYPINGNPPYKSIVLTPGWGGNSASISNWAEFYASHGFIAMRVGPNDEINDSHQQRGEGLLDGIESIKQENNRINSPLYGMIDENNFSVSGYSMGGGASHNAAMMDNSLKAVISLNPTVIFEDCNLCPLEDGYCICLVPEFVDHAIPSLIFAGEVEINELSAYEGMLGQNIYANLPESTDKIIFEGAGSGHGFAYSPNGEVQEYALNWLKYQVLDDIAACDPLLDFPSSASQYLTNISCQQSVNGDINGDVNGDAVINIQDIILTVNLVLSNNYDSAADLNEDTIVNVLDIVAIVNMILN